MSEFKKVKQIVEEQFQKMIKSNNTLFITDTDNEEIWETYLKCFPNEKDNTILVVVVNPLFVRLVILSLLIKNLKSPLCGILSTNYQKNTKRVLKLWVNMYPVKKLLVNLTIIKNM